MSFDDERAAIETRFSDNFTDLPIKFENASFTEPMGTPWVALTILGGIGKQASLNTNPLNRYVGIIQIAIFVAPDTGTATARDHADAIEAIFRNVQFSSGSSGTITTRTPFLSTVGVEGGWHQMVVSVLYQRDRTF